MVRGWIWGRDEILLKEFGIFHFPILDLFFSSLPSPHLSVAQNFLLERRGLNTRFTQEGLSILTVVSLTKEKPSAN